MQKLLGLILWFGSFIWAVVSIFSHMVEKQDLNIGHLICFVLLMLVSGMGRRIFFIRSVLIQGVGFGSAISSRIFCSRLLRSVFYYSSVAVFIYFINRLYVYTLDNDRSIDSVLDLDGISLRVFIGTGDNTGQHGCCSAQQLGYLCTASLQDLLV